MSKDIINDITENEYKYGFVSDIEIEEFPRGINEDVVRLISKRKNEPEWMLEFRLKAYNIWKNMEEPDWGHLDFPKPNYQDIIYLAIPKKKTAQSLDEVDPELIETFNKLGISLEEQKNLTGVAVDAVMDSVSVKTTFSETLEKQGIIFCSFGEAIQKYPDLVKQYIGTVVPAADNFYAALNSAVFSEGSFCYIPKGVRCPMELSTYFRINAANSGQFERTLLVADEGAYVSYMEGCTAPQRDENQLHAAVVELIAMKDAEIKYSTVQNWYPGDKNGNGGIYNLVTKRGLCKENAKISWTRVETGSAITWKYPGCVLQGDNSVGEFYSVALTNNYQQATCYFTFQLEGNVLGYIGADRSNGLDDLHTTHFLGIGYQIGLQRGSLFLHEFFQLLLQTSVFVDGLADGRLQVGHVIEQCLQVGHGILELVNHHFHLFAGDGFDTTDTGCY